jgi:hypothetical protein
MSLLDDVSIVVTPNAYKAGTLYGVLPTYAEGNELITNGDFDTDSDWGKGTGWSINTTSKIAECDGSQSANTNLNPAVTPSIVNNQTYLLSLDVTLSAGTLSVFAFSSGVVLSKSSTGTSTLTLYFTKGTGGNLYIQGNADFIGSVDNVSIKEVTSSDMDVTRATAATRVDENGLVNYAEIIGSEEVTNGDFSNGTTNWQVSDYGSIAASASLSIDNGAVKILKTADRDWRSSFLRQTITYTNGSQYEVKFKIKDGNLTSPNIYLRNNFDTNANTIKASVPITGSFVEHTYYFTADSNSTDISIGNVEWNNANTGEFFFVDDVSVKEVTRNNVPRIDYTGGGCPHILAEPQRTNLLVKSNDYSSNWVITGTGSSIGGSVTGISQDINGTSLTLASGGLFYSSITPISNGVMSIYMRVPSGTVDLLLGDPVGSPYETKTLTTTWQRFSVVDTGSLGGLAVYNSISGTTITIEVCAAQLEAGSYPTSYIPTSGSTVTRNQDIFSRDGIGSLINSTEGVLFAEINFGQIETSARYIGVSDGTTSNRAIFGIEPNASRLYYFFTNGGSASATLDNLLSDISIFHKIAIKWKLNDFALWVNGVKVGTDASGTTPSAGTFKELNLTSGGSSQYFFGKVKQLQVYKTALTDAQLTSLTS